MRFIKSFLETYKVWKRIKGQPSILSVTDALFKFAVEVQEQKKPLTTKLVLLGMPNGEQIDVLSLWCAVGERANPIDRIRELRRQNDELKRLAKMSIEGEMTEELKAAIIGACETFN